MRSYENIEIILQSTYDVFKDVIYFVLKQQDSMAYGYKIIEATEEKPRKIVLNSFDGTFTPFPTSLHANVISKILWCWLFSTKDYSYDFDKIKDNNRGWRLTTGHCVGDILTLHDVDICYGK